MINQRRVSFPSKAIDKQSHRSVDKVAVKRSLSHQRLEKSLKNIKIVQFEDFVDESLLLSLPITREAFQIPVFQEMPSVELQTVPDYIQTPRDFDEFRRQVQLYEDKLYRFRQLEKYKRVQQKKVELPRIDWVEHKKRIRSQVIRSNSSNAEYERYLFGDRKNLISYTDDVFLPNDASFRNRQQNRYLKPAVWKRIWYNKSNGFTYEKLSRGFYKTQNLLSCYFALPICFQLSLFQGQNFEGKSAFYVKLNKQGTWRYIMIDNLMPHTQDDISFLSGGFPLMLLQKAWAKFLGSYPSLDSIQKQSLTQILTDLTGAPSISIKSSDPSLILTLKLMLSRKYVVIATNQGNKRNKMNIEYKLGIPGEYSYPIERIERDTFTLRNVWGCELSSPFLGSQQVRLHVEQFKDLFDSVIVNKIIPQGYSNNVSIRQRKGFYSLVQLSSISEETIAFITLSQIDKLNNHEDYSHCKIILFETYHQSIVYLNEVQSKQKKTNLEVNLPKGQYFVLIQMNWIAREYETTLSILSSSPVELIKLKYNEQNNYLLTLKKQKTQSEKIGLEKRPKIKRDKIQRFRSCR